MLPLPCYSHEGAEKSHARCSKLRNCGGCFCLVAVQCGEQLPHNTGCRATRFRDRARVRRSAQGLLPRVGGSSPPRPTTDAISNNLTLRKSSRCPKRQLGLSELRVKGSVSRRSGGA